jgi:hypothetical protein
LIVYLHKEGVTGIVADGVEFEEGLEVVLSETDLVPEELALQNDCDGLMGYFVSL